MVFGCFRLAGCCYGVWMFLGWLDVIRVADCLKAGWMLLDWLAVF
jgi:hypothetical protein